MNESKALQNVNFVCVVFFFFFFFNIAVLECLEKREKVDRKIKIKREEESSDMTKS
jgi:hypothetical protein